MRLLPDKEAALWLRDFVPDPENFDWDRGNEVKSEKHGVRREEIESIFLRPKFVFAGKIVEPAHDEWRGLVLGANEAGRPLALIFTRRGGLIRPISCRPMRTGEKKFYESRIQEYS